MKKRWQGLEWCVNEVDTTEKRVLKWKMWAVLAADKTKRGAAAITVAQCIQNLFVFSYIFSSSKLHTPLPLWLLDLQFIELYSIDNTQEVKLEQYAVR